MRIRGKVKRIKLGNNFDDDQEAIIELSPQELKEQLTAEELQDLFPQPQYLSEAEIEKIIYEQTGVSKNQSKDIAKILANKLPKEDNKTLGDIVEKCQKFADELMTEVGKVLNSKPKEDKKTKLECNHTYVSYPPNTQEFCIYCCQPKPIEVCCCANFEEDLGNGVHPGYCKHCHNLLPQTLPHAKPPKDNKAIEEIREIKKILDNYDEFGHPIDPEHYLPPLAERVYEHLVGWYLKLMEKATKPPQEDNKAKPVEYCECLRPGICVGIGINNKGELIKLPQANKEPIAPTNPFRNRPPDTFAEVHYALCKMADKVDEVIQELNALSKIVREK